MKAWVETWGPLVTLASTVGLLVVTAWYAAITRSLAKSSAQSAESAKSAAESAARSVAAAVASVDVDFEVQPSYITDIGPNGGDDVWDGVEITCTGSTVFVHGCKLGTVATYDDADLSGHVTGMSPLESVDEPLPRRLHRDEIIVFSLPERDRVAVNILSLSVAVLYSLDGTSAPITREVEFWAPAAY